MARSAIARASQNLTKKPGKDAGLKLKKVTNLKPKKHARLKTEKVKDVKAANLKAKGSDVKQIKKPDLKANKKVVKESKQKPLQNSNSKTFEELPKTRGQALKRKRMDIKTEKENESQSTERAKNLRNSRTSKADATMPITSKAVRNPSSPKVVNSRSAKNSKLRVKSQTGNVSEDSVTAESRTKAQLRKAKVSEDGEEEKSSSPDKDLSKAHILQCISAIFHLTEEQLKSKNELFDGEYKPVFLQVTCIRVPKTPRRQIRLLLPHSIVSPEDEVALFVCDLQRGRRKDPEPTITHYEELLSSHDCTQVKTVIPLNQVRTEYDQFELKRRLVNSYDWFLVDGRIAGHMAHLLQREFYKKRKLPIPIRMDSKDLKHEIEHALKRTSLLVHPFGDTHLVQVGTTGMKVEDLAENVIAACEQLDKQYPGGWGNIRSVRIKTEKSPAIPIYVTLKNKNMVRVPVVRPRRPKAFRSYKGELTTIKRSAQVLVNPEGTVSVKLERRPKRKSRSRKPTSATAS